MRLYEKSSLEDCFKKRPIEHTVLSTSEAVGHFLECQKKPLSDEYLANLEKNMNLS